MRKLQNTGLAILLVGGFYISFGISILAQDSIKIRSQEKKIWTWEEVVKSAREGLEKMDLKVGDGEIKLRDSLWGQIKSVPALNFQETGLALLEYDKTIGRDGAFVGEMFFAKILREEDQFTQAWIVNPDSGQLWPAEIRVLARPSGSRFNAHNNIYQPKYSQALNLDFRNYLVVFNRYAGARQVKLTQRDQHGKKHMVVRQIRDPSQDIYYSPYGPGLHTPPSVKGGRGYLGLAIDTAFDDLRQKGVKSRADPDKLVADVVEKEIIFIIPHLEQSDFGEILLNPKTTFERVDVILDKNREKAFNYTKSSADAYGLVQYTQGTYGGVRKSYPTAELIKDFKTGARDHVNIIKAAILLIDYNRADLSSVISSLQDSADQLKTKIAKLEAKALRAKGTSKVKIEKELVNARKKLSDHQALFLKLKDKKFIWEQDLARYNGRPKWANQATMAFLGSGFTGDWFQKSLKGETQQFIQKFRIYLETLGNWQEVYRR